MRRSTAALAASCVALATGLTAAPGAVGVPPDGVLLTSEYLWEAELTDEALYTVPARPQPWYALVRQAVHATPDAVELGEPVVVARLCDPEIAVHEGSVAYRRDGDCALVLRAPDGSETVPPDAPATTTPWVSALSDGWYADSEVLHHLGSGATWAVEDVVAPPPTGLASAFVVDVALSDTLALWRVAYTPDELGDPADTVEVVQAVPLGPGGPGEPVELDTASWRDSQVELAGIGSAEVAWVRTSAADLGTTPNTVEVRSVPVADVGAAPDVRVVERPGTDREFARRAWIEDRTVVVTTDDGARRVGDTVHRVRLDTTEPPVEGPTADDGAVVAVEGELVVWTDWIPGASRLHDGLGRPFAQVPDLPVVSDVVPASGGTAGGTRVTVRGAGFHGAPSVTFGGEPGTDVVVVDPTTVEATAPPGTGRVPVEVTTALGASPDSLLAAYAYTGVVLGTPVRAVSDPAVAPGAPRCVQLTGAHGVPDGAAGVVVNVTTVRPTGPGYVVVYPDVNGDGTTPLPPTSTVNFEPGRDVANAATVALPASGRICYATRGAASTGVLVDVAGHLEPTSGVVALPPRRVLDTRPGPGQVGSVVGPLLPREVTSFDVLGQGGVPDDATAVLLNVTVTGPTAPGNLRVFPYGGMLPDTSVVNFAPGVDKANATIVALERGRVSLYADTFASREQSPVHVVVDVVGYLAPESLLVAVPPERVVDSRTDAGPVPAPLVPASPVPVRLAGVGFVPAYATAVVLNVTAVAPTANGNLRVYPDVDATGRTPPPGASVINYVPGRDTANQVVVALPSDGRVVLWSDSWGSLEVVVDLVAFVAPAPAPG